MRCPNCNEELAAGDVYCPVCGQEVQIVPDYDPLDEVLWDETEKNKQKKKPIHKKERKTAKQNSDHAGMDPIIKKICLCFAGLLICTGIVLVFYSRTARQSNYDYQLQQGIACYENEEWENAITYFRRARDLQQQADDHGAQAMIYLGRTYIALNEKDMAVDLLLELIKYPLDEVNMLEAYETLFQSMSGTTMAREINEMIEKCPMERVSERLQAYRIEKPEVSVNGGEYHYYVNPELTAVYGTVHYTLDGSTPDENSPVYEERLELQEGKNMLTAVAINKKGIISEPLFVVYTLNFDVPLDIPEEIDELEDIGLTEGN